MLTGHQTYLAIKALQREDGRWIEGWATTGREDRVGDVVVPDGALYSLPLPLLFAHKHDQPIGSVVRAEVTKAGIRIRAKLTEGVARAEEVWKLLQDGALTAVSIGFQALKYSALPNGGTRFDKWEWHELSVVSVPANPDARVSVAKCVVVPAGSPRIEEIPTATRLASGSIKLLDHRAEIKRVTTTQGAIDVKLFAGMLADVVFSHTEPLRKRIAELEARPALSFQGEWQSALPYKPGAIVRHGRGAYVALRAIEPGKCPPARNGGGWERIFREEEK
ncbi:HK97 family phage prohead protease [Pigmentiphaga sp. H8]|uniref:HK97 family phage prohead protease n=1 Tax=Pigmentiphaga sp. H8 TaxID=2488560 RepID=UPI001375F939|nr:HK97 family phage prohead protease [Pigmentiphaga sp. H8]